MIVFSTWRPRPGRYCRAGRETALPCACLPVPPFPGSWAGSVAGMACLHRLAASDWAPHQLVAGAGTGQGWRGGQRRESAVATRERPDALTARAWAELAEARSG